MLPWRICALAMAAARQPDATTGAAIASCARGLFLLRTMVLVPLNDVADVFAAAQVVEQWRRGATVQLTEFQRRLLERKSPSMRDACVFHLSQQIGYYCTNIVFL